MADAYWRYSDTRHTQQPAPASSVPSSLIGKRPRSDHGYDPVADIPSGLDMSSYYTQDEDKRTVHGNRDTDSINALYDRYLRTMQTSSSPRQSTIPVSARSAGHSVGDIPAVAIGDVELRATGKDQSMELASAEPKVPLPPDASNTLFVEGLPSNCTRREVAHIFRPFLGYKEVRLVCKGSRHTRGDPVVLCFVDFVSPAHAATAMDALQGYQFDELDHDSVSLNLQFARYPSARSGGGHHSKR